MSDITMVYFTALKRGFPVASILADFSIFGKDIVIHWYGAVIAFGFLLAVLLGGRIAYTWKIDLNKMVDVLIYGTLAGIVGARLYYVFSRWDYYSAHLSEIPKIWEGGLAIYGGVIGGLLGASIMAKIRKVSIPAMLDVASLGFLIGQAIGRWGNFINQEAFGTKTDSFLRMQSEATLAEVGGAAHPCFLYESVWCILGFVLLHFFTRKARRYDGQTFLLYIIWYGVGRFFIEGIRTDSLIVFGTIRVSQLLAAISVFAALILLFVFRNRTKLSGCGKKEIMLLNSMSDTVPGAEETAQFGTIFGDLGYEEPEIKIENAVENAEEALEKTARENAEAAEEKAEAAEEEAKQAAEETVEAAEEKIETAAEEVKEAAEETAEAAEEKIETAAEEAKEAAEEAVAAAEAAEEKTETAAEEAKEAAEEKTESFEDRIKNASRILNETDEGTAQPKAERLESAIAELEAALDTPFKTADEAEKAAEEVLKEETKLE